MKTRMRRIVTANTTEGTATIATDVRHGVESSGKDDPAVVDLWKTTLVDDELLAHGTMTTGTPSGHRLVEQRDAGGVVVDGGGQYHHRDQQAQDVGGQSALAAVWAPSTS